MDRHQSVHADRSMSVSKKLLKNPFPIIQKANKFYSCENMIQNYTNQRRFEGKNTEIGILF